MAETLYINNGSSWVATQLNPEDIAYPGFVTTTATTEAWYRVATMPLTSTNKNIKFRVKGVTTGGTAIGTATESIIDINFAYLTAQAASTGIALMANTSHSYNSWTSAEPGYVLLYVRCSCDATNAFIDIYKYKSVVVEMTCYPMMESDWTFATGTLTANPTVGSVRTAQTDLRTGMTSNGGYVSESAYSGYSTYGVLGGNTGWNHANNYTDYWDYIGYVTMDYNSSYLEGRSAQIDVKFQELSPDGSKSVLTLEDFIAKIKINLATHTDSATFNSTIPSISIELEGNTARGSSDFAGVITATSTASKTIKFYVKKQTSNQVHQIYTLNRYGRAFNNGTTVTTSYAPVWVYRTSEVPISALPTAAQGSAVYAITPHQIFKDVYIDDNDTYVGDFLNDTKANGVPEAEKSKWTLSYVASTRVFTVTLSADSYYYVNGKRYNLVSGAHNWTAHANTTGVYYFYFDNTGTKQSSTTIWDILETSQVAYVVYNSLNDGVAAEGLLAYELHGTVMSAMDHKYNHLTNGAKYISGAAISGYSVGTSSAAAISWGLTSGMIADEDLFLTTPAQAESNYYVGYFSSTNQFNWRLVSAVPIITDGTYIRYNPIGSGLVSVTATNTYLNYYIALINSNTSAQRIISIPGQATHSTLTSAQAETPADLNLSYLPFQEIVFLYRIIYKTNASGDTAAGKAEITEEPSRIITNNISSAISAYDHSLLTNRDMVDQHPISSITDLTTTLAGKLDLTGGTLTGDLTLEKDGVEEVGSHGIIFQGEAFDAVFTKELNMNKTGSLLFGSDTILDSASTLDASKLSGTIPAAVLQTEWDTAYSLANAATNLNTASAIVKRDSSGNFTAGTITAALTGTASGNLTSASTLDASKLSGTIPASVLQTEWDTAYSLANAATNLNTASAIVKRDASGDFSAGTITATAGNFTSLTVTGTLLTKDSQEVNIGDAIIKLNAEEADAPTEDAGIEVERGTGTNTLIKWNETTDRWTFTNDGTNYYNLPTSTEYTANNYYPTAFAWTSGTASGPTGSLTGTGMSAVSYAAIPSAGTGASGVVTTGTQAFAGAKTFNANMGVYQGMMDGTNAFTTPHIALTSSNTIDTTGFVGMTFATSSSANYGYSLGALRSTGGSGDLVVRFHSASTSGTEVFKIGPTGTITAPTFVGALTGTASGNLTSASTLDASKLSGTIPATVAQTEWDSAYSLTNAATNLNTASAIVKRDASGNFTAGTITAALSGNATTASSVTNALTVGSGLSLSSGTTYNGSAALTISHADTSSQASVDNTGRTYIQDITLDTYGHITAITSATETVTDTNYYPTTFAWTGGTTSGPTGSLTGSGMSAVSYAAIPSASASASGIITTGTQTIAGAKTLSDDLTLEKDGTTEVGSHGILFGANTGSADFTKELYMDKTGALKFGTDTALTSASTLDATKISGAIDAGVTQTEWDSAYSATNAATNANTVSTIVKRDASGNFSAGTITAALTGTASGNLTSSSTLDATKISGAIGTAVTQTEWDSAYTHAGTTTGAIHGSSTVGSLLLRIADNSTSTKFIQVAAANTISYRTMAETLTDIGATTVGGNILKLTNPSALSYIKLSATNTASTLTPAQVLSDIGAVGTAGGTVTGQIQYTPTTLATTGTVNLDFAGANLRTQAALTGAVTYTASNWAAGRSITVKVIGNASTSTNLTFPGSWVFIGTKPASIAAGKTGILTITSFYNDDANCAAAWAVSA